MIHECKVRCVSVTSRFAKVIDPQTHRIVEAPVYDARFTVEKNGSGSKYFRETTGEILLTGLEYATIKVGDVGLLDLTISRVTST